MIESLIDIDKQVFIAIHQGLSNPFFDWLMPLLRKPLTWLPLYLLFAFLAVKKYKLQGLYIILATALIVAICDRFSAGFMKPFFERLRPCHEPSLAQYLRDLVNCGGQYGFISSHATNHFGMAVIFTWFFKKVSSMSYINWVFYLWAGVISFAQIYVAKHYLGDVLVGMLFGILFGWVILKIFRKLVFNA
ncbi:MAG: phosphatase PAP2 family protein [Bacteroidetes bacterium]|nr:MAG: phosphatase PAP2 family protein [Bacteroidota bacterium]